MECAVQCQQNFMCTAYRPNQKSCEMTYLSQNERTQLRAADLIGQVTQPANQDHNIYITKSDLVPGTHKYTLGK
jgi:hypothetical protein